MKVLVTGGCGFIGSHVVDAFVSDGCDVVIIDNLSTGTMENLNVKAKFYHSDICSEEIEEIFHDEKPDIVDHHAAQISLPLSIKEPLLDAEVNIKGTLRLLDLSRKYGVKKFIFSSTGGAIYGEAEKVPTGEDYCPEPVSPYAISKFASEKYIKFFFRQHGLAYTILRYSNVYGPRQIPHGEAGVVAIFADMLLSGRHPVLNHFPEEKQGVIRDYCFVKDIARANIIAATTDKPSIFNIGTGKATHTLELYALVVDVIRKKGLVIPSTFDEPLRDSARAGDIQVSILNAAKAREEMGWESAYSVETGLAETVDWYLSRGAGSKKGKPAGR
ncbi:MAG: NAD-dependent epimerase/dehydratase family protein [Syntrophobacterales bacterium]|jgi:UDP-glucose 4-epimerase|nr:NAD-dependent epimerase/dehydratase family protein [Syntrophobacterales bacterium]